MADTQDTATTPVAKIGPGKLWMGDPLTDPNAKEIRVKVLAEDVVDAEDQPIFGGMDTASGFVFIGEETGESAGVEEETSSGLVDANDPTKVYRVDNTSPGTEENDALWTASQILKIIRQSTILVDGNGNYWALGFNGTAPGFIRVDENGNPLPETEETPV